MSYALKFGLFQKIGKPNDWKTLMKKDLKSASGKFKCVAAKNFNKIEQPTFVQVLNVKKSVPPPPTDWFVVDCSRADASAPWTPTVITLRRSSRAAAQPWPTSYNDTAVKRARR